MKINSKTITDPAAEIGFEVLYERSYAQLTTLTSKCRDGFEKNHQIINIFNYRIRRF